MARTTTRAPKPFLKWAGGKRQVLPELSRHYPETIERYHEPFLGGGAVFFDLTPDRAVLTDTNEELIETTTIVRDFVDELIEALGVHRYDREYYYEVRAQDPSKLDKVQLAARMIFLNKAGFNGLYRVNSKGRFNVPFGRHKNPTICDEPNLHACSAALRHTELRTASFEEVLDRAVPGDFIYFDPPYIPLSRTAYFTAYQKRGFGMDNQKRLAEVFDELTARGVKAMLSNSDVEWMHERYRDHSIRVIKARRAVSCDGKSRGPVGEVVVTNY